MIGIDTNVLLRWLIRDDLVDGTLPAQQEAIALIFENGDETLFINEIVVVEIVWVLKQRAKLAKDQIAMIIDALLNLDRVVVKERDMLAAALDRSARSPGDFSDHFIGEINFRRGCRTTMTFDKPAAKSDHFTELTR